MRRPIFEVEGWPASEIHRWRAYFARVEYLREMRELERKGHN